MKVSELVALLQTLPQNAEVVLPHHWETDPDRAWKLDPESVNCFSAERVSEEQFNPSSKTGDLEQIVCIG